MSREDLTARTPTVTTPYDATDPPRSFQLLETAKDAFASELRTFFTYVSADARYKINELPTIEKYARGTTLPGVQEGDLETVVKTMMSYADSEDKFPMIAITSTTLRERRMGIGSNFVDHVQEAPRVEGTVAGPFALTDGWTITLNTVPRGLVENTQASTITFASILFPDITDASIDDVVRAINMQALYYTASATTDGYLRLSCGGPCAEPTPNIIRITGGTAACLTAFGLTVGQTDTYLNTARPPKNRYGLMADLVVNLDVITDDLNERGEVSDLLYDFFGFWMEKRGFQFLGRSHQTEGITPEEWYHVIFRSEFSWGGEINVPRLGGDVYDYIYANRGSIPITIVDFIDRPLTAHPIFLSSTDVEYTDSLPLGDHGGPNWKRIG